VNLVARQLAQAGVIKNRRGRIIVTDRKGLEDVACECYAAEHLFRIMSGNEQTEEHLKNDVNRSAIHARSSVRHK
jgi:hypothetical protein